MSKVLVCGFENAGTDVLFSMLKGCANNAAFADSDISVLDLYATRRGDFVSQNPGDLFAFHKLSKIQPALKNELRMILMVRDPRYLLTHMLEDGVNYSQGFDHAFNVTDTGFLSFSNPGLLAAEQVFWKSTRNFPFAMSIRYEDLLHDPEATLIKVAGFAGLTVDSAKLRQEPRRSPASAGGYEQSECWRSKAHASRIVRQFRLAPDLFEILNRWRYSSDNAWYEDLAQRTPDAFDDTPGTIFAYFTQNTLYEAEAHRLKASVERLHLPLELKAVRDAGSWLANVRPKPAILLEARTRLRGPLLYVDADAVIHSDPWPYLRGYTGDVAVSTHHGANVISGTILLNDTAGARHLLELWIGAQSSDPQTWDQKTLHNLVERNKRHAYAPAMRVQYLPPEMCQVFDRTYQFPLNAVVEHLQASREMRAIGGTEEDAARVARRRRRVAEIDMHLTESTLGKTG